MNNSLEKRLEQYTLKRPQEILLVNIQILEEKDQILIFKGFSSSLMGATAADADVPLIPETAEIISIDRLLSPYNPNNPRYIQAGLSLAQMEELLTQLSV
ncbi:hypothetical protein [Gloeothece verrucosa]|uniref:DUF7734 domain-containing protein n=1 Tax=Gloeothece verrucosa (strain PCC 7822) TaxID=497965 RepID=E0U9U5_GLOV7|nr:hypothetical protein [Gloeothece verrucosa]ADN15015.1 conserved hypothetical protein [Gloeothece verrucosa PCC 7822]